MFHVHTEYLDLSSGFHVTELRNDAGVRHLVQIAVNHTCCPTCGAVQPRDEEQKIDPKSMVAKTLEALNSSERQLIEYARKHQLKMKPAR